MAKLLGKADLPADAVCPACGKRLRTAIFGADNHLLSEAKIGLINEYDETKVSHRCDSCGKELFEKARQQLVSERERLKSEIQKSIAAIPVLSLQSPAGWSYIPLAMVTAQSTTGTGVFSEFASAFTDFFGAQSGIYNEKIKAGEDRCLGILRWKALELGAHAVIAVDIDYAEVGGGKGMLMVCMTGTAIRLYHADTHLPAETFRMILRLEENKRRLDHLSVHGDPFRELY